MFLEPEAEKWLKWLGIGLACMAVYSCIAEGSSGGSGDYETEDVCYYMVGGPDC